MDITVTFGGISIDDKTEVEQYNTTVGVVSALEDSGNWSGSTFTDPGGILAQMEQGQIVFGSIYRYEFNGINVYRTLWV